MSPLQMKRLYGYGTKTYPASFEVWKVRPVYLVQCVTVSVARAVVDETAFTWRCLHAYHDETIKQQRRDIAAAFRRLRAAGVDRRQVREWALTVTEAPESYAGQKRWEARQTVIEAIRQYN